MEQKVIRKIISIHEGILMVVTILLPGVDKIGTNFNEKTCITCKENCLGQRQKHT